MPDFTHLHVHSEYSLLDGQSKLDRLIAAAQAGGMNALALTDHGSMYGSIDFYKRARKAGVKPILGCLLAGQEIITAEGVKAVEDVQVGDYVLTHKGRFRRVLRTMRRPYSGQGFTVALNGGGGRTLTVTEEHPILVRNGDGSIHWARPGEFSSGPRNRHGGVQSWQSWACLPRLQTEYQSIKVLDHLSVDFSSIETGGIARTYASKYRADESWRKFPSAIALDYDFGYLLGLYAAEGCALMKGERDTGGVGFTFHRNEMHLASRVVTILASYGVAAVTREREDRNTLDVFAQNVPLAYLLVSLCGHGARNKRVPIQVLNGPPEVRRGFLEGILDGDGKNPSRLSNASASQDLKTASRSVAWGVRALLADTGYWSSVSEGRGKSTLPGGKRGEYQWYMVSYNPRRTFARTLADEDYVFRPIKAATPVMLKTEVFNFEVEEDNSYVSDIVLHNCEGYLAPSLEEKTGRYDYNHLLLLAKNRVGYHNLLKLTTIAHTRGYHYRPRVDKKVLEQHAEGLIVTSSCLSGEIPELLLRGDLNGARAAARWYQDVFGPENFYIEVQDHNAPESPQVKLNPLLYDLSRETGAPLLATNDLHYVHAGDAEPQDVLLCVQTGKTLDDPKRMKFDSQEYYLKTPEEMARLFAETPEALKNTMRVAEMCEVEIAFGADLLPRYAIPPEFASQDEYLYQLCEEGVKERFGAMSDTIRAKLDYEFGIIREKGFISYFLIVWDYTNYARKRGMRCVARGSAAGSLVAYVLGITNVDPLRYDLLFERFLNPERMSMPDIDMDFPDDRREEVIRYVADKYGWDRVAQIVTFNTMAAKAAIRDVGRVMGLQNEADRLARLIPTGPNVTLNGALEQVRELATAYKQDPNANKIIDIARQLEGTVRGVGIHAAGVLISREPLEQTVPLQYRDYKDPNPWLVSQYEQSHLEELGLLKFDFLGLSNLTILQNCQEFIRQTRGIEIDLDRLDDTDAKTYALLGEGETTGVFQLESGAMRQYVRELKPTCIEDITAMVALYRPGPMDSIPQFIAAKHGRAQITYLHPALEPLLRTSYGVIVYQDQVLQIAVQLAGFSWGEVDKFRKAMSKKLKEEMAAYQEKFIAGCVKNGIETKTAEKIFSFILPFAGYGFNRAHAAAYAWVAYQTAYLKANYTAEFMAATLTTEAGDGKKVIAAIEECRRMGVEILPPDVNKSGSGFTVEALPSEGSEDGEARWGVRFGLLAIRGVGTRPIDEIMEARAEGGPFTSLADLFARTDSKNLTRGAVEALVKAGALDSVGRPEGVRPLSWRSRLVHSLDRALTIGQQKRKMRAIGQESLFGGGDDAPDDFVPVDAPEYPQQDILRWEKDLLNLYLSAHPLAHISSALRRRITAQTAQLNEEWAGQKVTLGGRITAIRRIQTKRGDTMLIAQLEDMLGSIEVTVFPRAYEASADVWREEAVLLVTGQVKLREEEVQVVCDTVEVFALSEEDVTRRDYHLRITLRRTKNEPLDVAYAQDVRTALERFPGHDTWELLVRNGRLVAHLAPPKGQDGVRYCPELHQQLEGILGPGSVEALVREPVTV